MVADPHSDGLEGREAGLAPSPLETLVHLVEIVRRRILLVVVTAAVFLVGGVLFVSSLKAHYRATATVLVHPTGPQILDTVQGVNEEDLGRSSAFREYLATQKEIINSRKVATMVLNELGLAADPVLLGVDHIEDPAERAAAAAEVDPASRLRAITRVTEVRNSRVLRISAEYPDPDVAKEIANEVALAYIRLVSRDRSDTGAQAKDNLSKERGAAAKALKTKELALDAFKSEHKITSISLENRQSILAQNISTLSARTKAAQAERIQQEALFGQVQKLHDAGSLAGGSLLDPGQRGILDALLAEQQLAKQEFDKIDIRYGDKHPSWKAAKARLTDVDGRITALRQDLLSAVKARYQAARQTERRLEAALDIEREKALALGRLALHLGDVHPI